VRLLPSAEVGFLGMMRNEETLEAITYANRLPDDLSGRQCYVLDPMLATGGTLVDAIRYLAERGADDITAITLIASPEGILHVTEALKDLKVTLQLVTGAVDERLNEHGYIVPGLGDAGDRLYGTVRLTASTAFPLFLDSIPEHQRCVALGYRIGGANGPRGAPVWSHQSQESHCALFSPVLCVPVIRSWIREEVLECLQVGPACLLRVCRSEVAQHRCRHRAHPLPAPR